MIDKNAGEGWPVGVIQETRRAHENEVDQALSSQDLVARDLDERLAARIAVWEARLGIDRWQDISYELNQPTPVLRDSYWKQLFGTAEWLLTIDWPAAYPRLADAFKNHQAALWLLTQFLYDDMTAIHGGIHEVDDPHHRISWDPPLYERLMVERQVSCSGIWLLALEVTRSINHVISSIRAEFDPWYRFDEGLVLLADGDVIFGKFLQRLEYLSESELLPPQPAYVAFVRNLETALSAHDSLYGRELDLASVNVAEWVLRHSDAG